MSQDQKNNPGGKLPAADTGNASNASPYHEETEPGGNQLLNEKAETYLRESGNIEDMPDAQDQRAMDETIQKQKED